MSKIRTSILGRLLGLNHANRLQCPGGFLSGDHGNQIYLESPQMVTLFDDFTGKALDSNKWLAVEGTDSATSDAAILAGGIGGVLRLTTGDAGTGLAADLEQIVTALAWQASNGLAAQCRVKLSRLTNAYFFFGFTDKLTLEGPIVSAASGNTITSNANNAVGFLFDSRMTSQTVFLVGSAANVDATVQNSGVSLTADRYVTLRLEINSSGEATFFINGRQYGTRMSGAITPATDLTPYIGVSNTSGVASFTADVDYIAVNMLRGLDGTATNN